MRFTDADSIAAAYFAGLEAMTPLRALDLRMIVAEKCTHCRGGPSTTKIARYVKSRITGEMLAERHEVCASCGRDWEPEPWGVECILRGEIEANARPGGAEDSVLRSLDRRLHLWPRLVRCVEPRPSGWTRYAWNDGLAGLRAHLVIGSYDGVSEAMRLHGIIVSADQVGHTLRAVRLVIEKRAKRPENGLLRVRAAA